MRRTQYITSGEEDHQLEMDNICQALVGNGFPKEKLKQWMHHEKSITLPEEGPDTAAETSLPKRYWSL